MKHSPLLAAEPLEHRIAPAAAGLVISPDGKRATWIDIDGDLVTLTASLGVLGASDFHFLDGAVDDPGAQLAVLDLEGQSAHGINLTFTAKRHAAEPGGAKLGDGSVNVGYIRAFGTNLGKIVLPGDLARLDAGTGDFTKPAVASITVNSAGYFGVDTQLAIFDSGGPAMDWLIAGKVPSLTVKGDVFSAIFVSGPAGNPPAGSIGAVTILGDIIGGAGPTVHSLSQPDYGTGYLMASGSIGAIKIGGDLIGGTKELSGTVRAVGAITSITVGGSVFGNTGDVSGSIIGGKLGPVKISGNLSGGPGELSGAVNSSGYITSVAVGGSIFGGSGDTSGALYGNGIGSVTVTGSLIGGVAHEVAAGEFAPALGAGSIGSSGKLGPVKIGVHASGTAGSHFGGSIYTLPGSGAKIESVTINGTLSGTTGFYEDDTSRLLIFNGIYSDGQLGPVKIGAVTSSSNAPVNIVAKGKVNPVTGADALAIASVTVTRGVHGAHILAGYDSALIALNPDVQIGAIKIGNNWTASSVSAGISSGTDAYFGNESAGVERVIQPSGIYSNNAAIRSKIASITVGGSVFGSVAAGDAFGFFAQEIGPVKLGGVMLEMQMVSSMVSPDAFRLGANKDFWVRESF